MVVSPAASMVMAPMVAAVHWPPGASTPACGLRSTDPRVEPSAEVLTNMDRSTDCPGRSSPAYGGASCVFPATVMSWGPTPAALPVKLGMRGATHRSLYALSFFTSPEMNQVAPPLTQLAPPRARTLAGSVWAEKYSGGTVAVKGPPSPAARPLPPGAAGSKGVPPAPSPVTLRVNLVVTDAPGAMVPAALVLVVIVTGRVPGARPSLARARVLS